MSGFMKFSLVAPYSVLASVLLLGTPPTSFADDDISDQLRRCSLIDNSSDRLTCYDALSGGQTPVPAAAADVSSPTPSSQSIPAAKSEITLDDLGAENLIEVRGTVTRCQKDVNKKYSFVFSNGQVWRQTSDKRVNFKHCNFDVTVTKDFFGYKMQIDGKKGRIRISRVK